jgi:NitT/TauT family transport system permease protein
MDGQVNDPSQRRSGTLTPGASGGPSAAESPGTAEGMAGALTPGLPGSAEQAQVVSPAANPRRPARGQRSRLRLFEPISRKTYLALAIAGLCGFFGVWSVLSYGGLVNPLFLPTPTAVWQAASAEFNAGLLQSDIAVSVLRIVLGFIISSAFAVPIGVLMGAYKVGEAVLEPIIDFIRYMPAVAFIPLTLIWFGTSLTQKIVILFIGIFFQEVLLVMDNVKTVPRPLIDISYTLGLSQRQILARVVFRAALPGIVDTLRISMGWAWTYLVVAELVGAANGLGFQIMQAQRYLDTPQIILGIIVIGILGLIFDFGFKAVYARSFPYMSRGRP